MKKAPGKKIRHKILRTLNLRKAYRGRQVVKDVCVEVRQG